MSPQQPGRFDSGRSRPGPDLESYEIERIPRDLDTGLSKLVDLGEGVKARILTVPDFGCAGDPRTMTLILGRSPVGDVGDYVGADYRAEILFQAGAGSVPVICDWANGTQLTAPATSIQVDARAYNPIVGAAFARQETTLSAMVAATTRPGCCCPRLSIPFLVPTATTGVFRIPLFATSVSVLSARSPGPGSGYAGDLTLSLGAGTTDVYSAIVTGPGAVPVPPTSPGAARLTNSGALNYRGFLVFDLAL